LYFAKVLFFSFADLPPKPRFAKKFEKIHAAIKKKSKSADSGPKLRWLWKNLMGSHFRFLSV